MSLFASLGQGDIWSISGISFSSPLNDILDRDDFTLEDLLREDELLQEIKSRNNRLIEFLSSDEAFLMLLDFIVIPPPEDADDYRRFKYPYISCEIFCCEIPEILAKFVDEENNVMNAAMIERPFSILDSQSPLNHYMAGYFEKLLDMLFRKMTSRMMTYINEGGTPLVRRFLKHVDNYSILQIIQRLMLPHIPFNMQIEMDPDEDDISMVTCEWSKEQEVCDLLLEKMLEGEDEVPTHLSVLMVTVLQISPTETSFISNLCSKDCLTSLFAAMARVEDSDSSVSTAAMSVLTVLISRLCEAQNPIQSVIDYQNLDMGAFTRTNCVTPELLQKAIDVMPTYMEPNMDTMVSQLKSHVETSPSGTIKLQSKMETPRLGPRGLQLFKLIEVLVRLESEPVDKLLCKYGIIDLCLKAMMKYELHSILHLSVQKIIIVILSGDSKRKFIQEHLLNECRILKIIMDNVGNAFVKKDADAPDQQRTLVASRKPVLGHLIQITEYIMSATTTEIDIDVSTDSATGLEIGMNNLNVGTISETATGKSETIATESETTVTESGADESTKGDGDDEKNASLEIKTEDESTPKDETAGDSANVDSVERSKYLQNILTVSPDGESWSVFIGNAMQDYIDTLQLCSPVKSQHEDDVSPERDIPSYLLGGVPAGTGTDPGVKLSIAAQLGDDSDEEDDGEPIDVQVLVPGALEFAQLDDGLPENEDLFANYNEQTCDEIGNGSGSETESANEDNGKVDTSNDKDVDGSNEAEDPFSTSKDPFASDDPFDSFDVTTMDSNPETLPDSQSKDTETDNTGNNKSVNGEV
jgi:hypothetical protein